MPVTFKCEVCGKIFECRKSAVRRFCCHSHYAIWLSHRPKEVHPRWINLMVGCDYCGNPIHTTSFKKKAYKYHFCDKKCKYAWMSARKGELNPKWSGGKKVAYERFRIRNCDKRKEYARDRKNKAINNLEASYIKQIIASGTKLSTKDIPDDLVQLWRLQLSVKRKLRAKEASNGTGS